ncbi:hypothetical protein [Bosea rubneri]|uniref:Uncharacterized protein n=1 Tax=Bosea rubneri TaxID=3075434 RepID=A0ABU3SA76_9HYPH|nr:hypothetical protein [Bosea sp. ZW T0_25]MDU0341265.1 hypothetical protein [Bosea sp. ZW T0_25]
MFPTGRTRSARATLNLQLGATTAVAIENFNEVFNDNLAIASARGTVLSLPTFLPPAVLFTLLGRKEQAAV